MTDSPLANYEMTFILRQDIQEMDVDKLVTKIQNGIASRGGQILTSDNWGKQRLAYPIGKNEFGYYTTLVFTLPKSAVADFELETKLTPEVIRHLIVSLDKENIRPDQLRRLNPFQEREYPTTRSQAPAYRAPEAPAPRPAAVVKKSDKDEATRIKELDEKLEGLLSDTDK